MKTFLKVVLVLVAGLILQAPAGGLVPEAAGSPPGPAHNPEADSQAALPSTPTPAPEQQPESQTQTPAVPEAPSPGDAGKKSSAEIKLAVACGGGGVCREKMTGQPFRVLPRSFSNVYKTQDASGDGIALENVKAFHPLYVFSREDVDFTDPAEPRGWYQVSASAQGPPVGWMQARDVLEWKQSLIVSYTHPGAGGEERQRVLMFQNLKDLKDLSEADIREQMALLLYKNVQDGKIPAGIVSKEPERYVDISTNFYVLPILDYEIVDIEGDEARYLKIAAAVPRKRGADTLADSEYRKEAGKTGELKDDAAKALTIDLVFVMDMTRSMQPYIDRTKQALSELTKRLADDGVKEKVRFGLVGYRDNAVRIPALEFTARNFTPQLLEVDGFLALLEGEAKATPIGSEDYPEEVFAGVQAGLASAWTEGALRFMYIVGDASSHETGHAQSTTDKNADILSLGAREGNVHTLALHLLDPRMPDDHEVAKRQFATLSQIEGSTESALVQIETDNQEAFSDAVRKSAEVIFTMINAAQSGEVVPALLGDKKEAGDKGRDAGTTAKRKMEKLMASALVEYLGKEANPPKDITVWAMDRDLTNPAVRTLDVHVLISKEQLSDLINAIKQITEAMARAEVSQIQFFEALQAVASQTMKNPQAINFSGRLADSGLLPVFIQSLPYRSEIQSLTGQMYASMTAEQRSALESSLRAKLQQYRDINEQVDGWVKLDETDQEGNRVYPLKLEYLP